MGVRTEMAIPFPAWVPPLARMELQRRYNAGEFSAKQFGMRRIGQSVGEHFVYSGPKPWGSIHVWVGRSEFLNWRTNEPDIEFQFLREPPEDRQWWVEWTRPRPTLRDIADKLWRWAINYNQLMRQYLKEGMSIKAADQMTHVKFNEDFIKACGAALDHLFIGG